MRRRLYGMVLGLVAVAVVTAVLLPWRAQMNVATATLLLIVPGVLTEVVAGFTAGMVTVVASALVLDFVFIPPYGTLSIGTSQNWVGFGVYLVVVALVGVVVQRLKTAHADARRNAAYVTRMYELTEMLVQGRSADDLLDSIVQAVLHVFEVDAVALFVHHDGRTAVAAHAGTTLEPEDVALVDSSHGSPVSLNTGSGGDDGAVRTVALVASGRPVGLLALKGAHFTGEDRDVLTTFANNAAIALEQTQLREQARRTALLEETDRLRRALMGAVSHDLRTPLATIKVASSTLAAKESVMAPADRHELHSLIEIEADRLTRLVSNLLDMTRIEAGVFEVHRSPRDLRDIVRDAVASLGASLESTSVEVSIPPGTPLVDVDDVLIVQVVANLLDNARRHSPEGAPVHVRADTFDGFVRVAVDDSGPGVAAELRDEIFDRFVQTDTGGRAGLGLTIARTFVDAHGGATWCEESQVGGARFAFNLSAVRADEG